MALDALPPVIPVFEISAATAGMSKGTRQSEGPQFIPKLILKARSFQVSGQWKNIDTNSAKGEAAVGIGWSGQVVGFDGGASVTYKILTDATGSGNRKTWEFGANLGRKFGKAGVKLSAIFSPDDFGATGRSLYVEAGPSVDLPWSLKGSAAVGIRRRENNNPYASFNAGVSRPIGKNLTADVRYYDTNRGELGENFDRRIVGSLKLSV